MSFGGQGDIFQYQSNLLRMVFGKHLITKSLDTSCPWVLVFFGQDFSLDFIAELQSTAVHCVLPCILPPSFCPSEEVSIQIYPAQVWFYGNVVSYFYLWKVSCDLISSWQACQLPNSVVSVPRSAGSVWWGQSVPGTAVVLIIVWHYCVLFQRQRYLFHMGLSSVKKNFAVITNIVKDNCVSRKEAQGSQWRLNSHLFIKILTIWTFFSMLQVCFVYFRQDRCLFCG